MKHTQNKILDKLSPYRLNCTKYMYSDYVNEDKDEITQIDIYSYNTYYRVMEIDNVLKNLELTLEYLRKRDFSDSSYNFITHHTFHIENFFLRLTSLIDRCYLFTGTSLGFNSKKIEKISGKKLIIEKLKELSHPNVFILKKLDEIINKFKKDRNKIAHQESYYRKNFIILDTIDNEDKEFSRLFNIDISIEEVKSHEIFQTNKLFDSLIYELNKLITELINNFDDIYITVISNYKKLKEDKT